MGIEDVSLLFNLLVGERGRERERWKERLRSELGWLPFIQGSKREMESKSSQVSGFEWFQVVIQSSNFSPSISSSLSLPTISFLSIWLGGNFLLFSSRKNERTIPFLWNFNSFLYWNFTPEKIITNPPFFYPSILLLLLSLPLSLYFFPFLSLLLCWILSLNAIAVHTLIHF